MVSCISIHFVVITTSTTIYSTAPQINVSPGDILCGDIFYVWHKGEDRSLAWAGPDTSEWRMLPESHWAQPGQEQNIQYQWLPGNNSMCFHVYVHYNTLSVTLRPNWTWAACQSLFLIIANRPVLSRIIRTIWLFE